ncbi:hypothetical protein [Halostreptopolyspora alba]|uniref:Uncharacterized protein n=1 Tax=Halostreptopolyspora alba TaxID=2487137 RepID=A0A3N0DYS3_9ACTN|nr:hypothetical protein EFW17_22335 [Nocardiopsaceae bacterium YIM 96095]
MTASLVHALVDDAGLFPPTALGMADAVERHRADLAGGSVVLSHRFLCPASRTGELCAHLAEGDRFRVGLVADTGADGLAGAVAEITGDTRLELAMVEFPLARVGADEPAAALAATRDALDAAGIAPAIPVFAEPASWTDVDHLVVAIAARRDAFRLKLRCGGVRAELFPSPEELAAALVVAARADVTVKATAGLHHAVRYTDSTTGFVHHGYLNLLVAAAEATGGADPATLAETLRSTDRGTLLERAAGLDRATVAATRRLFTSYGSCSTATPVTEARGFGLLARTSEP